MNKKELSEIRKNFNDDNGVFHFGYVVTAIVDNSATVKYFSKQLWSVLSEDNSEIILDTLKNVLKGKLSEKVSEYHFNESAYEENGAQSFLYDIAKDRFVSDEKARSLVERIAEKVYIESSYSIISAQCAYDYKTKDNDMQTYEFIVTALCPIDMNIDELVYDDKNDVVSKKEDADKVIQKASHGFLFPTFSDRTTDVNSVLYYSKNASKPNGTIIVQLLDCPFFLSAKNERKTFNELIGSVIGEDVDYDMLVSMNKKLKQDMAFSANDTEQPFMNEGRIKKLFEDMGVSEDRLSSLPKMYKQLAGGNVFRTANLCDDKTIIEGDGFKLTLDGGYSDLIDIGVHNGTNCIKIRLNSSSVNINGIDVPIK